MFKHLFVALVILRVNPWFAVALPWELVHHALHVARRETVDPWALGHGCIFGSERGRASVCFRLLHVVQQTTYITTGEV